MREKWCSPCKSDTHDYIDGCPPKRPKRPKIPPERPERPAHHVRSRPTSGYGGKKKHPAEYNIWAHMKQRCFNPKKNGYEHYGGRGITVCAEWCESFISFFEDVGLRPGPGHSIDRIDNDGNYEPSNVKWATHTEQMSHTRRTIHVDLDGEIFSVREAAAKLGLTVATVRHRLRRGTLARTSPKTSTDFLAPSPSGTTA